jgi:hypothetical protein
MKTGTDIPDLHRWMTYGRPLFVCIIMASFAVLLGAEPSAEGATHSRQPVATEGQVIASVYPAAGTEDEVEEWYAYVYQYRRRTGGGQSNWEICGRGLPGPECLTDHPADDTEPSLN